MDYDILMFKATGFYKEIRYHSKVLVPIKTNIDNKCELCHFDGKAALCSLISCDGVIYKERRAETK